MAMTKPPNHCPEWDPESANRVQISLIDVKRAYFNAQVDQDKTPCYVALPCEDPDAPHMCGKLLKHMYGTRMAADGWQEEYSTTLIEFGFVQGLANPNVFYHPLRGIYCSVHGDDFTSSGPKPQLDWMENAIAEKYEISIAPRMGPGMQDAKEGKILNRIIHWTPEGIEMEADPRQVETLIEECGLDGAKPVSTPGTKSGSKEIQDDKELPARLHTAFRGASARGNYLAADRIDAQFACKEICRHMSTPTELSWKALKRVGRYFYGKPRLVYVYPKQSVDHIDIC